MSRGRWGTPGPETVTVWRMEAVFCEGGGMGWVRGVPGKTFQDTQRDNLLIRGRLLQCAMRGDVHTCARV